MVTRACRQFDIAQLFQRSPYGRFRQRHPKFVMKPTRQINQPPAHNPMYRRDRAALNNLQEPGVPRDRAGSFDPQLIAKYQRRFPGFDDKIISMYARGMSTREITGHLRDLYGIDASPDLISTITDAVREEVAAWQQRPLDPAYPLVFFDAIRVRSAMRAWSATRRSILSWASWPTAPRWSSGYGWSRMKGQILAARHERTAQPGVEDIMLAVVDGLKGFPDAITAVFPEAMVQTCIVHLLRNSMDFVAWKDRKALGTALKAIYRAVVA